MLDIYGFEIFEMNSFEQLCINYCNEKLQQLFIELVIKREQVCFYSFFFRSFLFGCSRVFRRSLCLQEEYQNEGITWKDIEFFNNKIICDLVEDARAGIFAILDEKCLMVGTMTDKDFLDHMDRQHAHHKHYSSRQTDASDKVLRRDQDFRLKHFAGDVRENNDG